MAKKEEKNVVLKGDFFEVSEDGKFLFINPQEGVEPSFIGGKDARQRDLGDTAVKAASAYYWQGSYEVSEAGLHLYANPSKSSFEARVGYVASWYKGNRVERLPSAGWYPIQANPVRPQFPLGEWETDEHAQVATMKHDLIEGFFLNIPLKISIAPRQPLVEYFLGLWTADDQVKAKKASIQRQKEVRQIEFDSGAIFEEQNKRRGIFSPTKELVDPDTVTIGVKGDKSIRLSEMPLGWYRLVNKQGRPVGSHQWTFYNASQWQKLSAHYRLEKMPAILMAVSA